VQILLDLGCVKQIRLFICSISFSRQQDHINQILFFPVYFSLLMDW